MGTRPQALTPHLFLISSMPVMNRSSHLLLKILLLVQTAGVLVYTALTVGSEGWNFLAVALQNVSSLNWSGQFALDFSCYLTLSGLWIMWRGRFGAAAVMAGLLAMIFGILFFAPYLLWLIVHAKGDLKEVLVGR